MYCLPGNTDKTSLSCFVCLKYNHNFCLISEEILKKKLKQIEETGVHLEECREVEKKILKYKLRAAKAEALNEEFRLSKNYEESENKFKK